MKNLLYRSLNRFGFLHKSQVRSDPGFHAAMLSRIFNDWTTSTLSADSAIRKDYTRLRARCRQLREDNDYAKKFLTMLKSNVLGDYGIHLRNKAKDPDQVRGGEIIPGALDKFANKQIEDNWWEWGKAKNCTVTRRMTWCDVQDLILNTWGTDGECIIRMVRGFDNPFSFALQVLESDYLDIELNKSRDQRGHEIRMGVELNQWKEPVRYWFLTKNPNDSYEWGGVPMPPRYSVIDASEIVHPIIFDRPEQTRGVPPMSTAMSHMKLLGGFEEAAIAGARAGACQMGFLETEGEAKYVGSDTDGAGQPIMEAEPGQIPTLPQGLKFKEWKPAYPNIEYGAFMKACLRSVASGLGVSYNTLANDMESVNFASGKLGLDDERAVWKRVQRWFGEHVCTPIFEDWLEVQLIGGKIPLPLSRFDKFNAPIWSGKRWGYVNPQQEVTAARERIALRLTSVTKELAELGEDRDELFQEIKEEREMMEALGIEPADAYPEEFGEEDPPPGANGEPAKGDEDDRAMPRWFRKLVRSRRKSSLT